MRGVLFCHFARADFALPEEQRAQRRGAGNASPEEKDLGLALQDALAGTVQMVGH